MTYRNQPTAKNLPPYDLADGRTAEQSIVEEVEIEYLDHVEYEVEGSRKPDVWDMWAAGYEGSER